MTRSAPGVLALVISLTVAGCVTATPVLHVAPGASFTGYRAIEVSGVADQTGEAHDFDVAGTLTQDLRSKLEERGVRLADPAKPTEGVLIVNAVLGAYAPGNAALRWLGSGAGTTECIVKGSIVDKATGRSLGDFRSHKSVSGGGLFSVGADRRIVGMVAGDVADAIAEALKAT
jgi:hypothetical protein